MKYLWVLAMSVCIGLCVVIALSIPLQVQMTGAPIPFSADWAYYIASERQESERFYATQETVRIEKGAGKAEECIVPCPFWLGDFTTTPLGSDTLQGRETETWSCVPTPMDTA